jgi:molecular chaperone GrpE (heat shock protein)
MVGNDSPNSDIHFAQGLENDTVINVPFPYSSRAGEDDPTPLKIDYSSITVPPPKKTISVRRAIQQTRLVRLENSLKESAEAEKTAPAIPVSSKKATQSDASAKNEEIADSVNELLKSVGTLHQAAQETQRQYATISTNLEKQSTALPKIDALQKHLDQSHKVETANQRLFDVMHNELKGYKDNFLFDALQKPVIRDLLALFDDLCGQARRVARFINENPAHPSDEVAWHAELQASHDNINNTVFYIIEVLNRLDVTMIDGEDTVLDLKHHKVVGVEATHDLEEKNQIARIVRPGFMWKDRILRPTEVVIKKYSPAPEAE